MHKFKRYFEFAVSDKDDSIRGIAIDYSDVYEIGRSRMQFAPGSLGNIGAADVILNVQHDRGRPLCRTGGGGLELTEADNKILVAAELPPTQDGNDAHTLIARGVLRGFSLEVNIDEYKDDGDTWTITAATATGLGIVDRPAFPNSLITDYSEGSDRMRNIRLAIA